VSPGQISAVVPYATSETIAEIQVVNNGVASNVVTAFVYEAGPGVFTIPPGGVGFSAALHPDFSLVDAQHPARPGEIIAVFVTGLGDVFPAIADGAPAPLGILNRTTNPVSVFLNNQSTQVLFSGLVPTLAGLYQINIRIPDNARSGNLRLDIVTGRSYSTHSLLPVR
jgi:uncharacterized protein (TIGR03437 family)